MDIERLIGSVIAGAMGAKGKKKRKAYGYLTGGRRSSGGLGSLITPGTLLGAAGLAWGLFEVLKQQGGTGQSAAPGGSPGPAAPPSQPAAAGGLATPPPLPSQASQIPTPGAAGTLPPEALRLVRLAISAARADGTLSATERGILLEHARAADAEVLVLQELDQPRPLAEIVAGVHDAAAREQMYGLAYGIVRADEGVSGAERIFLAQLAHRLELDAAKVAQLEAAAAAAIDAQPDTP